MYKNRFYIELLVVLATAWTTHSLDCNTAPPNSSLSNSDIYTGGEKYEVIETQCAPGRYLNYDDTSRTVNVLCNETTGQWATNDFCNLQLYNCNFTTNCRKQFHYGNGTNVAWLQSRSMVREIAGSGPNGDHTCDDSFYCHRMQTGAVRDSAAPEGSAWFATPFIAVTTPGRYWIQFWYHMYGPGLGTLNVTLTINDTSDVHKTEELTTKSAPNADEWKLYREQHYLPADVAINFTYTCRGTGNGSVAIDDIVVSDGPWKYPELELNRCSPIWYELTLENGKVNEGTCGTKSGSSVFYVCDEGFVRDANEARHKRVCTWEGEWTNDHTYTCIAVFSEYRAEK